MMNCILNIPTPFTDTNEIDYVSLENYLDLRLIYDFSAIILGRNAGEFSSMDDQEILELLEFTIKKVDKKLPVYIQTGLEDNRRSMILSFNARRLGASALIVQIPKGNKRGIITHIKSIALSANMPIYIESNNTDIDLLETLVDLPNIEGVIENSKEVLQYLKLRDILGDKMLISSNEELVLGAFKLGANMYISELANILPEECIELSRLYFNGDVEGAKRIYLSNLEILSEINIEGSPVGLKTAMNMLKYRMGELRLPLSPLEPDSAAKIANMLIDKNIRKV